MDRERFRVIEEAQPWTRSVNRLFLLEKTLTCKQRQAIQNPMYNEHVENAKSPAAVLVQYHQDIIPGGTCFVGERMADYSHRGNGRAKSVSYHHMLGGLIV